MAVDQLCVLTYHRISIHKLPKSAEVQEKLRSFLHICANRRDPFSDLGDLGLLSP